MHRLWETVVEPVLRAVQPGVAVEIGVAAGDQSRKLLELASERDAVVHLIDPAPEIDPGAWAERHGSRLVFHRERSLNALPKIDAIEAVLIDGDHNWYTVVHELELLERKAAAEGRLPPVVLLHDVGWPYGRRDLYYDPEAIPDAYRHPHKRLGMKPDSSELVEKGGINPGLENAIYEHPLRNGVLTAIEDFREQSERDYRLVLVPGIHGIGILAPEELVEATPALAKQLAAFGRAPFLRRQCETLERARVELAIRLEARSAELARALGRVEELERADDERHRLESELERLRDRGRERGVELAELEHRLGETEEELSGARADRDRLLEEAEPRERELDELRGQAEALRAELRAGPGPGKAGAEPPPYGASTADAEARLRETFAERRQLLAEREAAIPGGGELGYVLATDAMGVLAPAGTSGRAGASVDVVVCVHNALPDVRRCLVSLLAAGGHPLHLILVNDGSDEKTSALLSWFARAHPAVELIENREPPHGYTVAANLGMRASGGDYVVLLNSDTLVTPGWLEEIVEAGESDPEIGVLGPLSNAATHQSIPEVKANGGWAANELPPWLTADGMAALVRRAGDGGTPRVPFVNGFCYVISRRSLEEVGYFDEEAFGAGFCEENDFSVRAQNRGFTLAIADRAYVHHAKSRSYGTDRRNEVAREHYRRFLDKHGEQRVRKLLARFESEDPLGPVRGRVTELLADEGEFPRRFRELNPDPLEVAFVLMGMSEGGGGGVHSIYQETRALRELGVPARVMLREAHLERAEAAYDDAAAIFEGFSGHDDLAERTASADVIVATHFRSATAVAALREGRSDFLPAYYVQDYEPYFAEPASEIADEALLSYGGVEGQLMFAKTDWLRSVIACMHGIQVGKVQPSIDHEIFHTRGRGEPADDRPVRVAAMVRRRSPRRQPLATARMLGRLRRELGDRVEVVSFGCSPGDLARLCGDQPEPVDHRGLLRREQVAELLRESDLFVDASVYQAFGRTGLEAMACGCAAVLPRAGGAAEYARDGVNALLVDTLDLEATHRAVASLAGDPERVAALKAEAVATARRYSPLGAALSEYVLFEAAHRRLLDRSTGAKRYRAGI